MFGRVSSIQFTLAVLVMVSASHAGVLGSPRTVEGAPTVATHYSSIDLHAGQAGSNGAAMHDRNTEVPSAPLPPALWPGLMLLVALGSARFAFRLRRRTVRA